VSYLNHSLVDIDQPRAGDGGLGNGNHVAQITSRRDQSSDCQTLAEGGTVEREESFKIDSDSAADIDLDVLKTLNNWDVLLVDIDKR